MSDNNSISLLLHITCKQESTEANIMSNFFEFNIKQPLKV